MLFQYKNDSLCQWQVDESVASRLTCKCCFVSNGHLELYEHFGKAEHSYGHWLHINLLGGVFPLWSFLRDVPDAPDAGLRDIAPLRMVCWLSCEVPPAIQTLLEEMMACFIRVDPAPSEQIFAIGCKYLGLDSESTTTWDQLRNEIVQRVAIGGRRPPPQEVLELMCSFLRRLALPRLVRIWYCHRWYLSNLRLVPIPDRYS